MTTITCDSCGTEMAGKGMAKLPTIRFSVLKKNGFEITFLTAHWRGNDMKAQGPELIAAPNDADICFDCILKAFKAAVAELEAPIEN